MVIDAIVDAKEQVFEFVGMHEVEEQSRRLLATPDPPLVSNRETNIEENRDADKVICTQMARHAAQADMMAEYSTVARGDGNLTGKDFSRPNISPGIDFLALPAEIRRIIYNHVIKSDGSSRRFSPMRPYGTITPSQRDIGAMLCTCKEINQELTSIFYSRAHLVVYQAPLNTDVLSRYGTLACSSLHQLEFGVSQIHELPTTTSRVSASAFPSLKAIHLNMLKRAPFWDLLAQLTSRPNALLNNPTLEISAEFLAAVESIEDWERESFEDILFDAERSYRRAWQDHSGPNFAVPEGLERLVVKCLYAGNGAALLRVQRHHGSWAFLEKDGQLWNRDGSASCHRLRWVSTEAGEGEESPKKNSK